MYNVLVDYQALEKWHKAGLEVPQPEFMAMFARENFEETNLVFGALAQEQGANLSELWAALTERNKGHGTGDSANFINLENGFGIKYVALGQIADAGQTIGVTRSFINEFILRKCFHSDNLPGVHSIALTDEYAALLVDYRGESFHPHNFPSPEDIPKVAVNIAADRRRQCVLAP